MEVHGFTEGGGIDATIDGVRMTVPDDISNRHRQMISNWESEGNTIPAYEPTPPTQEQLDGEAKIVAQQALSHMLAASIITDDERPEEQRRALAPLFPRWRTDEVVVPGDLRRHGEELFECIQGHTTQSDWEPNNAPALWKVTLPAGQIGPWKQPAGTHDAYQIGDKVTHNGSTWTSTHANNVWEPGVFGWMEEA